MLVILGGRISFFSHSSTLKLFTIVPPSYYKMKRKICNMGRPKEQLNLWDNWQEDIINLYKEGGSDVEVKALIHEYRGSFSNDLWDRWMIEEPNFSETIKTGKVLSEAYFHRLGRKNLYEKDFSYTGWYMQMKNRYGWKDNNAVDLTTKGDKLETPNIIVNTPDVAKAFEELKQMFEDETDNDV